MKVVFLATEIANLVKVGGLADVVYGLAKKLVKTRVEVSIFLPLYSHLDLSKLTIQSEQIYRHPTLGDYTVVRAQFEGISLVLFKEKDTDFFNRGCVYGEDDDLERFLFFSNLAAHVINQEKIKPVVHAHDWPVAFSLYLLDSDVRTVFTIHNLLHQGRCSISKLQKFLDKKNVQQLIKYCFDSKSSSHINLMKCAITYANEITTVSKTYSEEIQTKEFGYELFKTIREHKNKLHGILNGIDLDSWNPVSDPFLDSCFRSTLLCDVNDGKSKTKKDLLQSLGIKESTKPLFCTVTRIDYQKGPKLIKRAIQFLNRQECPFILLGSPSTKELADEFEKLALELKNSSLFHYHNTFSEDLAHKLFAAADFIVIPSLFEPCGLTQMIAMRYGTIPIVRQVGGLADTVIDIDTSLPETKPTGLTFQKPTFEDLDTALERSLRLNGQEKDLLITNGLGQDFSWENSANHYLKLYLGY